MISLPLSSNNPYLIRILSDHLLIISDPPDLPFILSNLMCYMHLPHFLLTSFICPTCVIHMFLHALPMPFPYIIHAYFIAVHRLCTSCFPHVLHAFTLCLTHVLHMFTSWTFLYKPSIPYL